jgi:hypothetical protein
MAAARPIASVCVSSGGQTGLHNRGHDARLEDGTPVDDRHGAIHAKPDACDDGGQVPRSITARRGDLPANSFQPDTPEPAGPRTSAGEQRVASREGSGGALGCSRDIGKAV